MWYSISYFWKIENSKLLDVIDMHKLCIVVKITALWTLVACFGFCAFLASSNFAQIYFIFTSRLIKFSLVQLTSPRLVTRAVCRPIITVATIHQTTLHGETRRFMAVEKVGSRSRRSVSETWMKMVRGRAKALINSARWVFTSTKGELGSFRETSMAGFRIRLEDVDASLRKGRAKWTPVTSGVA